MDVCRRRQIRTAGHQGDSLDRIIDGNGEVIACRHVFAGENDIAKGRGFRQVPSRPVLAVPSRRPKFRDSG